MITKMSFQSVSKNCIKEWYILRGVTLFIFTVVFGFCAFIPTSDDADVVAKTSILIVYGMFLTWLAVYALIFPVLQYKRLKYKIEDGRIEKQSGVIFLHRQFVPFVRIQHAEIYRGITDRIFNMATVIIYTAGSAVKIQNLDTQAADDLISHIKKLLDDEATGDVND